MLLGQMTVARTRHQRSQTLSMNLSRTQNGVTPLYVDSLCAVYVCYICCRVWNMADVKEEEGCFSYRELHRASIYTTEMSKQVEKSHVRDTVHMYLVN
jgi:hypothetical protein